MLPLWALMAQDNKKNSPRTCETQLLTVLIVFVGFQQVISRIARKSYTRCMGIACSRRAPAETTTAGSRNLATGYNSIRSTVGPQGSSSTTVDPQGSSSTTVRGPQGSSTTPAGGTARFRSAVRRVIRLLALRKKWAAYGRVLQESPRCKLWEGLERRKGELRRVKKLQSP